MIANFIRKVVKEYLDSRFGNIEQRINNVAESVNKNTDQKLKVFEEKVFITNEVDNSSCGFTFPWPWATSKPQSLEQRVQDLELQMEALTKHLKVSINFESTEGYKVKKLTKKQ